MHAKYGWQQWKRKTCWALRESDDGDDDGSCTRRESKSNDFTRTQVKKRVNRTSRDRRLDRNYDGALSTYSKLASFMQDRALFRPLKIQKCKVRPVSFVLTSCSAWNSHNFLRFLKKNCKIDRQHIDGCLNIGSNLLFNATILIFRCKSCFGVLWWLVILGPLRRFRFLVVLLPWEKFTQRCEKWGCDRMQKINRSYRTRHMHYYRLYLFFFPFWS